jgi:hypothetical protein
MAWRVRSGRESKANFHASWPPRHSEEEQAPKKSTRRWDREQIREEESVLRRLRISHEMGSGAALVHVDSVAVFLNFNRDQNRSREKMLMQIFLNLVS